MLWLTWRQFRTQAITGAITAGIGALCLLVLGLRIRGDYADTLSGCLPARCAPGLVAGFEGRYDTVLTIADLLLAAVPGLLGVFWGAPLISAELAAGTQRLAWHQSVARTRWLAVKLAFTGLSAVAVAGLLGLLLTWSASPYDAVKGDRFAPLVFGARGLVPFAYAAFAVALGAVTGLLLRRPVAAMGLTLAVFTGLQFAVPTALRPHYLPPRTADIRLDATTLNHADGIILNGSTLTIGTVSLPDAWVVSAGHAVDASGAPPDPGRLNACMAPGQFGRSIDCLAKLDLHVTATYHPETRYWPFQLIEAALYALAAALLVGLGFRRIGRRTT
ncbi:transporter [Kitasatospora sp. NPDC018058]|uniref:transporter n=1 Tax=Kitasatospora sp. NPDC018058 TaxID=3364025 RepID=UPI0037BED1C1